MAKLLFETRKPKCEFVDYVFSSLAPPKNLLPFKTAAIYILLAIHKQDLSLLPSSTDLQVGEKSVYSYTTSKDKIITPKLVGSAKNVNIVRLFPLEDNCQTWEEFSSSTSHPIVLHTPSESPPKAASSSSSHLSETVLSTSPNQHFEATEDLDTHKRKLEQTSIDNNDENISSSPPRSLTM